jgi:hypothetical protein
MAGTGGWTAGTALERLSADSPVCVVRSGPRLKGCGHGCVLRSVLMAVAKKCVRSVVGVSVALVAVACGGRVVTADGSGGASASGNGGPPGSGGAPGAGGTSGVGGGSIGGGNGQACTSDAECQSFHQPSCVACPDGTSACAGSACAGGTCVNLVPSCNSGSCNPLLCPGHPGAKGCCLGPNGPCGEDRGGGCGGAPSGCAFDSDCPPSPTPCQPCPDGTCAPTSTYCSGGACITTVGPCAIIGQCNPAFCTSNGTGKGCCQTTNGPCGIDYGNGCVGTPPCMGCPPPPPPTPDAATAAGSCREIQDAGLSTGDGLYWIRVGAGAPFAVHCLMSADGGGWTLVGNFPWPGNTGGVPDWTSGAAVGASFTDLARPFKLSDADINALRTYGFRAHGTASYCMLADGTSYGPCTIDTLLFWRATCSYASDSNSPACSTAYRDAAFAKGALGTSPCAWHWGLTAATCDGFRSTMGTSHSGNHVFVGEYDSFTHAFDGRPNEDPSIRFWVR